MNDKDWIEDNTISEIEPLPADTRSMAEGFNRYLRNHLGHFMGFVPYYLYEALALTVRDRIMYPWHQTWQRYNQPDTRKAYYLSLEFLIGRSLVNSLANMDIEQECRQALLDIGLNLEELRDLCRIPEIAQTRVMVGSFEERVSQVPVADMDITGLRWSADDSGPDLDFVAHMVRATRSSCLFTGDSGRESALA